MSAYQSDIEIDEIYAALNNELDDLYTEGLISAAIFRKKAQKRMLLYNISRADRHICLQMKVSAMVSVYVPADQRTVFFGRQPEFVKEWFDEHSDMKSADAKQYALLIDDESFLDVVSVISPYAYVYGDLPINKEVSPDDVLENSLASETEHKHTDKYLLTSGKTITQRPSGKRFYVEPNSRKLTLSEPFDSPVWLKCLAQIAPTRTKITQISKSELDCYKIRSPYYTREWLINRSMVNLLSGRISSEAGYFELEQKGKKEAFDNKPGTGNVVLSGRELDGNYESDMHF